MTLIYKGAKGITIRIETSYDLTGYDSSATVIKVVKPDLTTVNLTPSSVDAALGYVNYVTSASTFDQSGEYQFQVHFKLTGGAKEFDGEIDVLKIYDPITVV